MRNFQRHYERLLKQQAEQRERVLGNWEAYEIKEDVWDYLDRNVPGICSVTVSDRINVSCYPTEQTVEEVIKHVSRFFDVEFSRKLEDLPVFWFNGKFHHIPVHVSINMEDSQVCERIKVGEEVVEKWEIRCR